MIGTNREMVDIEKQLRELLRSNPLNAQDANVLRSRYVLFLVMIMTVTLPLILTVYGSI